MFCVSPIDTELGEFFTKTAFFIQIWIILVKYIVRFFDGFNWSTFKIWQLLLKRAGVQMIWQSINTYRGFSDESNWSTLNLAPPTYLRFKDNCLFNISPMRATFHYPIESAQHALLLWCHQKTAEKKWISKWQKINLRLFSISKTLISPESGKEKNRKSGIRTFENSRTTGTGRDVRLSPNSRIQEPGWLWSPQLWFFGP